MKANTPVGPGIVGVVDEEGNLLKQRVQNAAEARAILYSALTADTASLLARTQAQAELDGKAPYDPAVLSAVGQPYRTNYNFRTMRLIQERIAACLREVWASNPNLISVQTTFGSDLMRRNQYSEVLSTELTKTITSMPGFASIISQLLHNFSFHGLGVAYFEDAESWYFRAGGLGEFVFERKTKPQASTLEVVFATRTLKAHELYAYVRDAATAKEAGWNVEEVMKVLRHCSYNNTTLPQRVSQDTETMLKNQDLTLTDVIGTNIPIAHMWVQEFDGSVTHAMFFVNGAGAGQEFSNLRNDATDIDESAFLYIKPKAYESMEQAFTLFPLGSSTNGDIHALRGYGNDLYPHTRCVDKLLNQAMDAAFIGMSMNVQATSETARLNAMVNPMGPYTILDQSLEISNTPTPNLQQVAGFPLNILQQMMRDRLGEIDSSADGGMGRTQLEAEIRMGNAAKVSNSMMDMLLEHLTGLFREVVRRFIAKGYDEDVAGAKERKRMLDRLRDQHVPEEALYAIDLDSVCAIPPIGAGSQVRRTMALRQCLNYMQFMPRVGQERLIRMAITNETNARTAEMLMPYSQDMMPSEAVSASVAALQNDLLLQGMEVPVLPGENHRVHAEIHANRIVQMIPTTRLEPEQLAQLAPQIQQLAAQLSAHLEYLRAGKETIPEFAQYEELLRRCNEVITNGMRALQKIQEEQAKAESQQPPAPDPEAEAAMMKAQQEMALKQQQVEAQIAIDQRKAEAEMQRKAVEANLKAIEKLQGR